MKLKWIVDVKAEGHVVIAPVCVVSKSHYLTSSGWIASSENSTALPFALARESERTYLQWLGDPRLRSLLEGRIVLIKLLCKDTSNAGIGVFSPCIAFRVAGSPGKSAQLPTIFDHCLDYNDRVTKSICPVNLNWWLYLDDALHSTLYYHIILYKFE